MTLFGPFREPEVAQNRGPEYAKIPHFAVQRVESGTPDLTRIVQKWVKKWSISEMDPLIN